MRRLLALVVLALLHHPVASLASEWITSVKNGGEVLVLSDGTVWRVDSIDVVTSQLWLPMDDVVVKDDKIINTD